MKKIQFAKPSVKLSNKEFDEIKRIISSGWYCEGRYVEQVEDYFKTTYGVKYAISCSSATQGLVIALKSIGMEEHSYSRNNLVALPSFTWPSTLYAISCNQMRPKWLDINIQSWDLSNTVIPKYVIKNSVISDKIEAIISVDIFGNRSYVKADVPVIYDAAHGFGLKDLGKRGLAEVVSFSFTKPVTGMQGGIILTDDDMLAEYATEYRRLSAKMCEINALILMNEIKRRDEKLFERLRLIELYRYYLDISYTEQVIKEDSNYSTYCILLDPDKRDRVAQKFMENNIEVKIYYKPLVSELPNTNYIYSRIISLPIYSEIEDEIPRICKIINEA